MEVSGQCKVGEKIIGGKEVKELRDEVIEKITRVWQS